MATPFSLSASYAQIRTALENSSSNALPQPAQAAKSASSLHTTLPPTGLGEPATLSHLLTDVVPGFSGQKLSANYYGFVTGGVLPIAEAADNIVTAWDQNVQVHLPEQSVSTAVEARALEMLVQLLRLGDGGGGKWEGKTFTTGATASNVLGLACGREAVLRLRLKRRGIREGAIGSLGAGDGVGELGVLEACRRAGVEEFQVLTTLGHSSLYKAASIVGLGRKSVKDVGTQEMPWKVDMENLETRLRNERTASIVVVSCGEINSGRFATSNWNEMVKVRELCDQYGAWLHVDGGAFGLSARALPPGDDFTILRKACEGIELADSITGDAHKCLNVPYDCGFFFTQSLSLLTSVFRNPNAAYLSASNALLIPSPLNIGIENSRRLRALPVYSVLVAYGRSGLESMFARQVRLARLIAAFISAHSGYQLLPSVAEPSLASEADMRHGEIGIIVLFRAVDLNVNKDLASRINKSCKTMVSGTVWEGRPAVRIAVSTWTVEEERDLRVVTEVLESALL